MNITATFAALSVLAVSVTLAGWTQTQPPPARQPARPALTVDEITKLVKAGVSEDVVISLIKKNGQAFNLTAQQVLQLKSASVTDNVIKVMLDPKAEVQPAAAPAPAVLPPELPPAEPGPPAAAMPPEPALSNGAGASVPDESGVYWLAGGRQLVRLEGKALSNIRTGNMLTHSVTLGIKKLRINAQLKGAKAETRVRERQPRFYLRLPEDASAGDYLLVHLVQREDVRQLEIGQSRFFKTQAGVDHTMEVDFSQERIKPRLYLVIPKTNLEPGEYGFYPAAGTETNKPSGRIYDFGVDP
jgi:hypothetical protein